MRWHRRRHRPETPGLLELSFLVAAHEIEHVWRGPNYRGCPGCTRDEAGRFPIGWCGPTCLRRVMS